MRIALVHDWLTSRGGAERVLLRMHALWPDAPIFTLAAGPHFIRTWLPDADVRQAWPGKRRLEPWLPALAPLLPSAIESLDLSDFDVVVSSSVMFSKGVVTRTRTRHISYCYSPSRMLWDRNAEYERRGPFSRLLRHGLRLWDFQAAQRPDVMLAISKTVRGRIAKYYRRDSLVMYPPLLTGMSNSESLIANKEGDYYLAVGRLVPHKNFGVLIDAFNKLQRQLVIVGSGPLERALRRRADACIRIVSDADDTALATWYAGCRALVLPNEEDFGLTAVEAMAYGKPVLALRAGGATETVREGITGEFFDDSIPEALAEGVLRLEQGTYDPDIIRKAVEPFAKRFDREILALVNTA